MPYENYAHQFKRLTRKSARLAVLAARSDQFRYPVESWVDLHDIVAAHTARALWEASADEFPEFGGRRGRLRRVALKLARFFDEVALALE